MMFKEKVWKSPKYVKKSKGQPCTLRLPGCTGGGEDTVPCHLNGALNKVLGGQPLGVGMKADDFKLADGCSHCHHILDNPDKWPFSPSRMLKIFIRGMFKTMNRRLNEGVLK